HRTDLYPFDAGRLDRRRQLFGDLLVHVDDHAAFVIFQFFQRNAAHDAVAHRLDDLARFHDRPDVNAVDRAAVVFADDHVLRYVDQAARQIAGIGRLQRGIGQTFTGAVGRNEVLQHRQSFAEVGGDGRLDDLAGRLGHEAAHAGKLADLLLGAASARISHHVNGIQRARLVGVLHHAEHLVGNFFRHRRPDLDHLVLAFAVGDGAVQVLLLNVDHLLFGVAHQALLVFRDQHVVNADGETRLGGVTEAQLLDAIQHL